MNKNKVMFKKDLEDSHRRIMNYIHRTPVLTSGLLNDLVEAELFFKCENFQRMGAFKMRGASNAILRLSKEELNRGVVTHSSGNMAQAVALAAKSIGIPAYIVMPDNAPEVKINAVKSYGAEIIFCEAIIEERQRIADDIIIKKGAYFIHPSNDYQVILGQGTAAKELIEDVENLDSIVVPVGGGGLLAGTALSVFTSSTEMKCFGAEPEEADDACRSLKSGKIENNITANTIADGLRTILGSVNFPIIKEYVDDIFTVSENEITQSMKLIYERMKIVIEPSSAVVFAAVLKNKEVFNNKRVGLIVSGGNVDLTKLPF